MGSNSSRYADYDRSTIILPSSRPRHGARARQRKNYQRTPDEIINEYYQVISNHQMIDTIKKSKIKKLITLKIIT